MHPTSHQNTACEQKPPYLSRSQAGNKIQARPSSRNPAQPGKSSVCSPQESMQSLSFAAPRKEGLQNNTDTRQMMAALSTMLAAAVERLRTRGPSGGVNEGEMTKTVESRLEQLVLEAKSLNNEKCKPSTVTVLKVARECRVNDSVKVTYSGACILCW